MMLITGTLGHCGEPTKFYAYYIFALNVKGILKEVQQDSGASASVCISAVLQDSKIISFNPLSQGSS